MADPNAQRMEQPGYNAIGTNGNYTRKMLDRTGAGLGEAHATLAAAKRLFRTVDEVGFDQPTSDRRVFTLEGVTQGLGLDSGDAQRIQALIADTPADFGPKSHPKIMQALAKITNALRRTWDIPAATRMEIVKRARAYYQNTQTTDYGDKQPSILYAPNKAPDMKKQPKRVISKAMLPAGADRPPKGFIIIPKSKKGGYKSPDGKQYWYPDGKGVRGAPHGDDAQQAGGPAQQGPSMPGKPGAPPPKLAGKQGAAQPPPGAQKPAAGEQGAAGGKGKSFEFTPPPKGADHDEIQMHHKGEVAKVKHLYKQAAKAGDQEEMQRLHAIGNQHAQAHNESVRQQAAEFAQGGADEEQGQEGSQEAEEGPDTRQGQQPPDKGAPQPPQGAQGQGGGNAQPQGQQGQSSLFADPQEGLARTSTGVTSDAQGNRVTAANPRQRPVPESEMVKQTREKLGRALNVMADLSAAHDDLSDQKRQLAEWKRSGHPMAKQAVATLRAQIALSQADITQLEAAHGAAMQEVQQAQAEMQRAKIKASPIFQAFMSVMDKIGSATGSAVEAAKQKVGEVQEGIAEGKKNAALAEQTKAALSAGGGIQVPESKSTSARERQKRVAIDLNPQVSQAEETLRKLAAQDDEPDIEEVDAELEPDEDINPEDLATTRRLKANPATVEGPERAQREAEQQKKDRALIDKLESEGRFGGPEQDLSHPDSGVRRKASDADEQSTVRAGRAAKETESPIARKKRIAEENRRKAAAGAGMAKSMRRKPVALDRVVKSEAWRIALDLGMQAKAELRKAQPEPRLIVKSMPSRHVPYFFNEL